MRLKPDILLETIKLTKNHFYLNSEIQILKKAFGSFLNT